MAMGTVWKACMVVAVGALLLGGSVCLAQPQALTPLERGRIRQGPYMVFGDVTGGLHVMRGSEIVVYNAGIYCQGRAGYFPFDRMAGRKTLVEGQEREEAMGVLGLGTFAVHGEVPGTTVTYDQQVSIEGDRVRIRLVRNGDWAGDTSAWEGFFFELPFQNFRGTTIRADGEAIKLPETFSPDHVTLVRDARRIECSLDDPSLNLILECDHGMSVSDRRRWKDLRYLIDVGFPAEPGRPVDLYLTLPQVSEESTWAVRRSLVGYPAAGEKKVVLEWPRHLRRPADDSVRLERADGTVVKQGRFADTVRPYEHMQSDFAVFDFSEVVEAGDYRIVWARGALDVAVRPSVFEDALWEPTLDYFLPFQMCHAAVDLGPDCAGHPACHMDDGIRVPARGGRGSVDGFRSYECEGTPYDAGDPIPCARGGWHDAGDCDLNIYAQGFAVLQLALAYEEFGLSRDVATADFDARTWTLGRPDETPDILQQVEWGALWLLSMMQPDGRSYVGVVDQPTRRSSPGGWDKSTDNVPGTGDEREVYVDYHAELQCMQATALCAAGRVLRASNPALSAECIEAARRAYEYFRTHEEVYRNTAYFNTRTIGRDGNVACALAELHMTTGDPRYLQELEAMTDKIDNLPMDWPAREASGSGSFWFAPPVLVRLVPGLPDGALKEAILKVCRQNADYLDGMLGGRPWAGHYTDFGKCGNAVFAAQRVYDAYWISKVLPERRLLEKAVLPMLWLYGLHPISDHVFVSGIGLDGPKHLHSGHLFHVYAPEGGIVPGVPVPGYTTIRPYRPQDNALYFLDDGNVANMESTIGEIGHYIFAVNAMKAAGF
ncbi:MAG: hypothetical protein GXY85_00200 [Candidatus Brocadiaceae bacterium]|nr:hypothetical protein [Candidatus Brocadiaceae bacterium]